MIKFSKKILFISTIVMTILFVLAIRDVKWELVLKGESIYLELRESIVCLLLIIIFLVYYVNKLKEEKRAL